MSDPRAEPQDTTAIERAPGRDGSGVSKAVVGPAREFDPDRPGGVDVGLRLMLPCFICLVSFILPSWGSRTDSPLPLDSPLRYTWILGLTVLLGWVGWLWISIRRRRASKVGIVVGVDGVLVRGRFIPRFKIGAVCHEARQRDVGEFGQDIWVVFLRLEGGEEVDLIGRCVTGGTADAEGAEFARAIEAARANWIDGQRGPDIAEAVIGRNLRTGSGWLQALRSIASGTTTATTPYRGVEVDNGELSRLLEDTQTKLSIRASAAIVLAASGDRTTATRLRIASEAMASPQLRMALERVADGSDDAAIAEALEILDEADREEQA